MRRGLRPLRSTRCSVAWRFVLLALVLVALPVAVASAGPKPTPVKPANTAPPTISGIARAGQVLTADPGTWTGTQPITYSYQWRRCDARGSSCVDLAGATGQTYTVAAADVGSTLRVAVKAKNSAGSSTGTVQSAATAIVAPAPVAPANSAPPAISGTPRQGEQLTATSGTWTGTQPISYAYQWRRCGTDGTACADIAGATGQSYTVAAADVGSTMRLAVTATNAAGSSTASSAPTATVAAGSPPSNTAPPQVSGTASLGSTLTADPGTWAGAQPISYSYQWRRCDASYRESVLSGSPVGFWRLGESSGSVAADQSGNGNGGTYGGTYSLGQAGALTDDPDTAVRFGGSPPTGNVIVPDSSSLDFGDSVTFEVWVRLASLPPSTSAGANLLTKNTGSMLMRIYPSGAFALRKSGGTEIAASTATLSPDGKFHHLVGTKSGDSVHLYLDGADVTGPVTNQTLSDNALQLAMGHNPVSTADGLDGDLDEVAVYDHPLSSADVQRHYAVGRSPACVDVTGARSSTYVVAAADVGSRLRVDVTASNAAGSATASSAPTAAVAAANAWASYKDQPIGDAGVAPTGSKPESKLWFHDGSWWSVMWSAAGGGFHIFRLSADHRTWSDTGVQVDDRPGTRSDALWSGGHLYVASHVFSACGCSTSSPGRPSRLLRYSYDAAQRTYALDPGFPVAINDTSTEALVIDRDSTGMLWATWVEDSVVKVAHSLGSDDAWSAPFSLPAAGATGLSGDDLSSVVAFGGDKIGVMWSDQPDSAMYFSIHADGDPDSAWTVSRNAVPGPNFADDHINLKSLQGDASGRVFAAVKTSLGDLPNPNPNAPQILLLVRDPVTGDWSNYVFGRVGEDHTRPIVLLDSAQGLLHVFATAPTSAGTIYEKTSPIDQVSFAPGLGTPVLRDPDSLDMSNVTSTKQTVDGTTGLVVMASNDTTQVNTSYPSPTGGYYWHAYQPLGP